MGERARLAGLNLVGLERRGFEKSDMRLLMRVFKELFHGTNGTFRERLNLVHEKHKNNPVILHMLDFAMSVNSRPLCQPK